MNKVMHNFARVSICIVCIIFLASLISLGLIFNSNINSAHAVNPQSVDYNVYVKPSLNVSVSSNSVVLNINPAGSLNGANNPNNFASNNLNVSVATNNQYGYRLYMNSNTSDLVKTDDNTEIIPTLDTSTTESNFPYNKWGYKFSTDTDYQPFQANTNIPISSSDTATNEITRTLNFGAKANYDKKAGTYELDLNFKALPTVTTYYMQDIAKDSTLAESVCTEEPTVVIDKRDEQAYTIRRINGACWMVENLKFTGTTIDSTTSNIAPEYTPSNPYQVNGTGTYGDLTSGNSYDEARIHEGTITVTNSPIDSSTTSTTIPTIWYNYAAASAGTITGESNTNPQIYDICPAGWRLPNYTESLNLATDTVSDPSIFNPIGAGRWIGGSYTAANGTGYWWISNLANANYRRVLLYNNGGSGIISANGNTYRHHGMSVRCVMKGANLGNFTYMQDFAKVTNTEKANIINNTEQEKSYQLIDTRESSANSYWISKLKDGNIWMLQNLQLGKNSTSLTLTSADSNISSSSWVLNNKVSVFPHIIPGTSTSGYITDDVTGNNAGVYDGTAYYCTPASGNNYVGCYYNWYTATAGTGTSSMTSKNIETEASSSICPKGWVLPKGTSAGDFQSLNVKYPLASDMLVTPTDSYDNYNGIYKPGFTLAGRYGVSTAYIGTIGMYWSRTAYSTGYGYVMMVSSSVSPYTNYDKYIGMSVRCLSYGS